MNNSIAHILNIPACIWSGCGCSLSIGERIKDSMFKRVFVFIDPNVFDNEFGQNVIFVIRKSCESLFIWNRVEINTPRFLVEDASSEIKFFNPEVIIAIGGGSTIDLSKAALVLATNSGNLDEFWEGKSICDPQIPIFAIPTTCGTGSDSSPFAVVLDPNQKCKRGITSEYIIPKETFLDPLSLVSLPQSLIAFTGIDAFCHCLEVYVSSKSTELTRCATLGPLITIHKNILEGVLNKDMKSLESLLVSATSARLLYPRTGLTITHAMSHPLGAFFNIHHGNAVARLITPTIIFNSETHPSAYANIARLLQMTDEVDDTLAANKLVELFKNLFKILDLKFESLLITKNSAAIIENMVAATMRSSNIPSNPRPVTREDIQKLFEEIVANESA